MASDGAVKRTRGNRDEIQHERDDAEGIRARAAAQAACKRKIGSQQGLSGFWKRALRMYQQADDVVSMPFLIGLSLILSACIYFSSPGRPPVDVGEGGGEEWRWVQGVGKDVVGKVNCTTYLHIPSGVLVELGHGSGGGLAFKVDEKSKVRCYSKCICRRTRTGFKACLHAHHRTF